MRTWIIATIYLGVMAGLYGALPASQDSADPNSVLQKEDPAEDLFWNESDQTIQEYRDLRYQLMWDQVESIKDTSNQSQAGVLDDLIHQLRSLEIPQKSISKEPVEPEPVQVDVVEDAPLPEEIQADAEIITPAPEKELIETLEKLDRVLSPLQLADVLYRQGYYEPAFKNYSKVFDQLAEDRTADRQWILFQKANCRRHSDLNEAIRLYSELIRSFPNSKWAAAANSQLKMIEWTQANQINDVLEIETNDTDNQ